MAFFLPHSCRPRSVFKRIPLAVSALAQHVFGIYGIGRAQKAMLQVVLQTYFYNVHIRQGVQQFGKGAA